MEVGNITKTATFKSCDNAFQYFYETNINQLILGVT